MSAQPDQLGRSRVPGQSSHQNATMAISGSEKVTSGPSTSSERSGAAGADGQQRGDRHHEPEPDAGPSRRRRARRAAAEIGGRDRHRGHRVHHELGRHRQLADAAAGGVEDRVGDRRGDADLADLADALGAERADELVVRPRRTRP